jgi:hypothetical protein
VDSNASANGTQPPVAQRPWKLGFGKAGRSNPSHIELPHRKVILLYVPVSHAWSARSTEANPSLSQKAKKDEPFTDRMSCITGVDIGTMYLEEAVAVFIPFRERLVL